MSSVVEERVARCRQILDRMNVKATEVRVTVSDFRALVTAAEGYLGLYEVVHGGSKDMTPAPGGMRVWTPDGGHQG